MSFRPRKRALARGIVVQRAAATEDLGIDDGRRLKVGRHDLYGFDIMTYCFNIIAMIRRIDKS